MCAECVGIRVWQCGQCKLDMKMANTGPDPRADTGKAKVTTTNASLGFSQRAVLPKETSRHAISLMLTTDVWCVVCVCSALALCAPEHLCVTARAEVMANLQSSMYNTQVT